MGAMAYFLTWTTYATWLPGDSRGWIDDAHNQHGEPYRRGKDGPSTRGLVRLREEPFAMNADDRELVASAICGHCEYKTWFIHALNVRTNHIHLVVTASELPPAKVAGQLKTWATRRLKSHDRHARRTRFWTNQGSTRYLFTHHALAAAIRYTNDQ